MERYRLPLYAEQIRETVTCICLLHFVMICKPFTETLNCYFQSSPKDSYKASCFETAY
jgi:hypothetical protein